MLELRSLAPVGPEGLIRELLAKLPVDSALWDDLSSRFDIRLMVAVHFTGWNKGFDLPPDIVAAVAAMRAAFSLDLYAYGGYELDA